MSLPKSSPASRGPLEVIAETMFELAEQKIGALIVVPGNEPLERHLSGGVQLDGAVSRELLQSIFDPSSDGHDGAAILNDERIERFGVHLPISTNLAVIQGHGTRHSAAVGLTECSDAVVIVVSEERGVVSVAQRGGLKVVNSPVDLLTTLNESSAIHGEKKSQPSWTRHITTHWRLKVLALSMSIIAWFVLAYDPTTVARTFEVSIDYGNLPPGLVLEQSESHAQLTLSGRKANFRYMCAHQAG